MAVSREAKFIDGIWGPYFSAMVPGMWLTEGGQSATGALIDHVVGSHPRSADLEQDARTSGKTRYALLNERLEQLSSSASHPAALTAAVHVLPYFHGNRSPRADATLRGMVSGLRMSDSVDALAILYLATIQAIAHGTRHILDEMDRGGYAIDTIFACGGDLKNPVFVREHADVTGRRVALGREPEAVLLGAAILGAVACGDFESIDRAMGAMSGHGAVRDPSGTPEVRAFHEAKHRVFHRMYGDQLAYRELMAGRSEARESSRSIQLKDRTT
jgi:ribulose kinase